MREKQIHVVVDEEIYYQIKRYCLEKQLTLKQLFARDLERFRTWKPADHVDNLRKDLEKESA